MTECDHRWIDDGKGRSRVRCSRCDVRGTVSIETPPPCHLERARQELDKNLLIVIGRMESGQSLPPLHRAVFEILCYLEGKD